MKNVWAMRWLMGGITVGFLLVGCGESEPPTPAAATSPGPAPAADEVLPGKRTAAEPQRLSEFRARRDTPATSGPTPNTLTAIPNASLPSTNSVTPPPTPDTPAAQGQPAASLRPASAPSSVLQTSPVTPPSAKPTDHPNTRAGAPTAAAPSGAAPSGGQATVFREHQMIDPEMKIVASTVLVPEGWTAEGGMTRLNAQYYSMPFMVDLKFTAPDGRQAHFLPSFAFEFNAQQPGQMFAPTGDGNMTMPLPDSPGAWLAQMNKLQPDPKVKNFRVVSEEMIPDITQQLRQQQQQMMPSDPNDAMMEQQTGMGMRRDTQATLIKLQYTQDATDYEESVLMVWSYFFTTWQGQVSDGKWSIPLMRSCRGPVGTDYGNDPQIMTIFQSARNNPQWDAQMNQYWNELARIRNKGTQDRIAQNAAANQKLAQTYSETSDIIANGYKSRTASQDAGRTSIIDSIHEVTPYTTPGGEAVKLPSFYDNVYTDGNGRYLLNNDALYQPNTDPAINNVNWDRIEPSR